MEPVLFKSLGTILLLMLMPMRSGLMPTPEVAIAEPVVAPVNPADLPVPPEGTPYFTPEHLAQSMHIYIEDDWIGYSPLSPIQAHTHIAPEFDENGMRTGAWKGTADFSVSEVGGKGNRKPNKATESVTIPAAQMQAFFEALSKSTVKVGTYQPRIEHTDDYPRLKIVLVHPSGSVVAFSSQSQGSDHNPWMMSIAAASSSLPTASYIVPSGAPAQAIQSIEGSLKYDVLAKMKKM